MSDAKSEQRSMTRSLEQHLEAGAKFLGKPPIEPGKLAFWTGVVRSDLEKIYGRDSPVLRELPEPRIERVSDAAIELARRMQVLRKIIETLNAKPNTP